MRPQRLRSITVGGFRSIADPITVPLDAPVVLIHGLNGAGKTSLLSAIEYGLTGQIASLDAVEKGYRKQLAHYGSEGSVLVETEGVEVVRGSPVPVTSSGPRVRGLLNDQQARFFGSRCYLAQSTLSQLLTIYGTDEGGLGSPLSQFAADLLGLDRLDALQQGLRPARDVRNLRQLAPNYRALEERRGLAMETLERTEREVTEATARSADSQSRLKERLDALGLPEEAAGDDLDGRSVDALIAELTDVERDVDAVDRAQARLGEARLVDPRTAAVAAEAARADATRWRDLHGAAIADVLAAARAVVGEITSAVTPEIADLLTTVGASLREEADRRREALMQLDASNRNAARLDDALTRNRAAIATIERRVEAGARLAPDLAAALAAMLPHIHGEDCPVCGRDYSEVGGQPLRSEVERRIAELRRSAVTLATDTSERSRLLGATAEIERERATLAAVRPSDEERLAMDRAAANIEALASRALEMMPTAREGAQLLAAELHAARVVEGRSESDAAAALLRDDLARLEAALGIEDNRGDQPPGDRTAALRERVRTSRADAVRRSMLLGEARELRKLTGDDRERLDRARAAAATAAEARRRVGEAERAVRSIRDVAGRVEAAAADARARVVSEVFNEQLNHLWRDLFVRLAPDERFVPRFDVPESTTGRLRPVLGTRDRSGEEGGSPTVMLSSGNLNTAALTLFLSLHLAVPPTLPWLVLDDPVQAMDDLHVASFASLLRTLAKEKGRQIIIAVHNRALFDYLTLEMTPAFAGDELITVEFERSASGVLRVDRQRRSYRPRPRIVAAA